MKTALLLLSFLAGTVSAQELANTVPANSSFQSGIPVYVDGGWYGNGPGVQQAVRVGPGNLYWVPGYLPGFPSAHVYSPRVVNVPCKSISGGILCSGFSIHSQQVGNRGEFILFRPVIEKQVQQKVLVYKTTVIETPPPLPLLKKKIRQ